MKPVIIKTFMFLMILYDEFIRMFSHKFKDKYGAEYMNSKLENRLSSENKYLYKEQYKTMLKSQLLKEIKEEINREKNTMVRNNIKNLIINFLQKSWMRSSQSVLDDSKNNILELENDLKSIFKFTNFNFTEIFTNNANSAGQDQGQANNPTYLINNTMFCSYLKVNNASIKNFTESLIVNSLRLQPKLDTKQKPDEQKMILTAKFSNEKSPKLPSFNHTKKFINQSILKKINESGEKKGMNLTQLIKKKYNLKTTLNATLEQTMSSQRKQSTSISKGNFTNITSTTPEVKKEIEVIEVCSKCIELDNFLKQLTKEVLDIKNDIKNTFVKNLNQQQFFLKFTKWVTKINNLRADIFKLNDLLELLKTSNCSGQEDNSKKLLLLSNASDHLVEIIQSLAKKEELNLNVVALS